MVQFGSVKTGELQAQALLDGLKANKGEGPYNIELFGGGPADPNAPNFFTGAMSVLQPEIDAGNLVVVSGQTDFTQCATEDWDNSKAQKRMDSLLAGNYSDKEIHGVLSPNDGIGRAIITACEDAGQPIPVVTGLDAENESVEWVWQGKQYCTVAKPTQDLVAKTIEIIDSLQAGQRNACNRCNSKQRQDRCFHLRASSRSCNKGQCKGSIQGRSLTVLHYLNGHGFTLAPSAVRTPLKEFPLWYKKRLIRILPITAIAYFLTWLRGIFRSGIPYSFLRFSFILPCTGSLPRYSSFILSFSFWQSLKGNR